MPNATGRSQTRTRHAPGNRTARRTLLPAPIPQVSTELETFEAGPPGGTLTTVWDLITGGANGTGTWTFDSSRSADGRISAKLDVTTSSNPAADSQIHTTRLGTVSSARLYLTTGGNLQIRNGGTVVATSSATLTA